MVGFRPNFLKYMAGRGPRVHKVLRDLDLIFKATSPVFKLADLTRYLLNKCMDSDQTFTERDLEMMLK